MDYDESNLSFLRTTLRFYSALAILEPQNYVVVLQFWGKISRCSAGVLFFKTAVFPALTTFPNLFILNTPPPPDIY